MLTAAWSSGTGVTLAWAASTDNLAVTGYRIYRDGEPFTTLDSTGTQYVDDDVANLSTHSLRRHRPRRRRQRERPQRVASR